MLLQCAYVGDLEQGYTWGADEGSFREVLTGNSKQVLGPCSCWPVADRSTPVEDQWSKLAQRATVPATDVIAYHSCLFKQKARPPPTSPTGFLEIGDFMV